LSDSIGSSLRVHRSGILILLPCAFLHAILTDMPAAAEQYHRLLSVSAAEVCFRWKDYAHPGRQRTLTLASEEFLRRFVQHVRISLSG
jgi:hypothetical protein